MKRAPILVLLVLAAVGTAFAPGTVRAGHPVAEFCPWSVGAEWEYSAGAQTLTERLTAFETIGEEQCARVETVVNGQVVAVEHLSQRADGLYRVAVAGELLTPALCYLKFPATDGQQWNVRTEVQGQTISGRFTIGEHEVTVPAGVYQAIHVRGDDFQAADARLSFSYSFAPRVGKVQQVIQAGDRQSVFSLKAFRPGKANAGE